MDDSAAICEIRVSGPLLRPMSEKLTNRRLTVGVANFGQRIVPDYHLATYHFLLSQKCSKKIQKSIDTPLALWDSRSTHGNK